MIDVGKVKSTHTRRDAIVYIRQSHPSQVENNRESTARQYALVEKAIALGWAKSQVTTIDEDLGVSGKVFVKRSGFDHLNAEVALGRVGILLGLEVSRLARSNADWYRLLDMCAITDTLLADSDGVYHPALFNDRLILGLKGTMSEAELHILRGRLDGGIRNKAARGELRRALPVGLVWGEKEGEIRFHPDEAVTGAIRTIFDKFTELGSARQVWVWFRSQHLSFPHAPPRHRAVPRYLPSAALDRSLPIPPSIMCSAIRCMLARTCMVRPATSATSMSKARSENEFVIYPSKSGLCFFPDIMKGSSIGQRLKPFKRASNPTSPLNSTKQVVP